MANRLCVQYTKFVDLDDTGKETDVTWGIRVFDDYANWYSNHFASLDEVREACNAENVWDFIAENAVAPVIDEPLFDPGDGNYSGLLLNDVWVER